jgi:hypothetical protein
MRAVDQPCIAAPAVQLAADLKRQKGLLTEHDTALGKARNEAYMTTGASNLASAFPLVRSVCVDGPRLHDAG